ncbi:hypothetical protein P353_07015 [Comamonas testosteroni]|uniref:Uncharacterized protein n=1 Tax=Comamonas testosteroni TaxID=285 RepID=A0A096HQ54_COMTE|nr:hypothetical protein P353_07015 [Comamonas testosteroni]
MSRAFLRSHIVVMGVFVIRTIGLLLGCCSMSGRAGCCRCMDAGFHKMFLA